VSRYLWLAKHINISVTKEIFHLCNYNVYAVSNISLYVWCMCDHASYITMTRRTNLMQQPWFIIINYVYMFRVFICPSLGVQVVTYCMWYSAQCVVAVIPEEPARSPVRSDKNLHTVHKTTSRLLGDYSNYTLCWIPHAVSYNLYSYRWAYKCPKYVQIVYDNKSQLLHQVGSSRHISVYVNTQNSCSFPASTRRCKRCLITLYQLMQCQV
jgi:hypothetical protein